jgi:hypothetical protein
MLKHKAGWTTAIALSVMVLGIAGAVFVKRGAPAVVTTSCNELAVDAQKLFARGDTAVLSGRFTPGDHLHLVIDFKGVGYKYVLTGVIAEQPWVTGRGWWRSFTRQTVQPEFPGSTSTKSIISTGDLTGLLRMDLEMNVTTAGEGAIIVSKTNSVPSLTAPKVVTASCNAAAPPTT